MSKTYLATGCLLLMLAGTAGADQTDPRLDKLFLTIQQTSDVEVADSAEREIWEIWLQHDNDRTEQRLSAGINAMDRNPGLALSIFDELIATAPEFAEAWNKRATLYYLLGEYSASESDIERTLALEPRHFGALSGLGLVYLAQSQYTQAISAFEAVLVINPHNRGARQNIELINEYMRRHAI